MEIVILSHDVLKKLRIGPQYLLELKVATGKRENGNSPYPVIEV